VAAVQYTFTHTQLIQISEFDVFHLVVHIQLKITKHSPTQLFIYSITAMFQGDMLQLNLLSHHQAYAVT
jgi:hypothetical protein